MTISMDSFCRNQRFDQFDGIGDLGSRGGIANSDERAPGMEELDQICSASVGSETQNKNSETGEFIDSSVGTLKLQFLKSGDLRIQLYSPESVAVEVSFNGVSTPSDRAAS